MIALTLTDEQKLFADNVGCLVSLKNVDHKEVIGVNLGLYFPEVRTQRGVLEPNGVRVFIPKTASRDNRVYIQQYNQLKIIKPVLIDENTDERC